MHLVCYKIVVEIYTIELKILRFTMFRHLRMTKVVFLVFSLVFLSDTFTCPILGPL